MSKQDAIDYLEDLIKEGQNYGDQIIARDDEECLRLAIEALKKQVLKKPINEIAPYNPPYNEEQENIWVCPECGIDLAIHKRGHSRYCFECGQAIDWSDDNEYDE